LLLLDLQGWLLWFETPEQFEERKLKEQKEKDKEVEKIKLKRDKPTVLGQPVDK